MKEEHNLANAGGNEAGKTARGSGWAWTGWENENERLLFWRVNGVNGIVMCIDVAIFLITAMVFLLKIIFGDTHTERDVLILTVSLFLVPVTTIMYFSHKFTNIRMEQNNKFGLDNKFGRTLSAMTLLSFPAIFFYAFFFK